MGGTHHFDTQISNNNGGSGDDDYEGDGIPLNDATRAMLIAVHYAAIPAVTLTLWCFLERYPIFRERIWSPFLLTVSLTWLLIGSTFEISNHFYVDNWQLYDPQSDLINGSFSFFNFGAQNLLALSLRKQGQSFCRKPLSTIGDWLGFILDPILMILIAVNPIVYGVAGRSIANTALSPIAGVAGLFTLFRVWKNLGPNTWTLWSGIGFFILAILGVVSFAIYNSTEAEWVHIFIGGCFVCSTIPLSVGFYHAQSLQTGAAHQRELVGDTSSNDDRKECSNNSTNETTTMKNNDNGGEEIEETPSQPSDENI